MGEISDRIKTAAFECDCGGSLYLRFFDAKGDHGIIEVTHRKTENSFRKRVDFGYGITSTAAAATALAMIIGAIDEKPCGLPAISEWEVW